jgi:hypothetical protein
MRPAAAAVREALEAAGPLDTVDVALITATLAAARARALEPDPAGRINDPLALLLQHAHEARNELLAAGRDPESDPAAFRLVRAVVALAPPAATPLAAPPHIEEPSGWSERRRRADVEE